MTETADRGTPVPPADTRPFDAAARSAAAVPEKHCDLVMKGGITSGVVYPKAVVRLASEYRFDNIGGTSAGAIAAVITAAAEYGRESGGFDRIAELPEILSAGLIEKFQPYPEFKPAFDILLTLLRNDPPPPAATAAKTGEASDGSGIGGDPQPPAGGKDEDLSKDWSTGLAKAGTILRILLSGYWRPALLGAAPGLFLLVLGLYAGAGTVILGLVLGLLGGIGGALVGLVLHLRRDLPKRDYGLCPGSTQFGHPPDTALSDWLARTIDSVAGLAEGEGPLTVRMLDDRRITVKTVTTDITTHRPYVLPMRNNTHAFDPEEFGKLFPDYVVEHMVSHSSPVADHWQDGSGKLRYFTSPDLPVVVLARMSLSFPGLIPAVPLWRRDFTLSTKETRRVLFSDGGVSSNFPVHFFDTVLPQTPTFGISLGRFDEKQFPDGRRVRLPTDLNDGRLLATKPISGVLGFVMALFNSAKDWQDSLQSVLTGYRERIVTINLKDDEGGLNLEMPPQVIDDLTGYGEEAGNLVLSEFDLRRHRWRRFLTEEPAIEELLLRFAQHWDRGAVPGSPSYPDLIASCPQDFGYRLDNPGDYALLRQRAEMIAELGRHLRDNPLPDRVSRRLPKMRARLRNIAEMEDPPVAARNAQPPPGTGDSEA